MRKIIKELLELAKSEGIERPQIITGDPHGRLVGSFRGQPIKMVVTLSSGKSPSRGGRGSKTTRSNIRRLKKQIEAQNANP